MHCRPASKSSSIHGLGGVKGKMGRIQSGGTGRLRLPMEAETWGARVRTGTSGLARDLTWGVCGGVVWCGVGWGGVGWGGLGLVCSL